MKIFQLKNINFKVDSLDFLDKYPKKYWKYSKIYKHLYYTFNGNYINYVELVRGKMPPFNIYKFKNNNEKDVRKKNIQYYDLTPCGTNITIAKSNQGVKIGFRWVNPYWKIITNKTIYYIMHIKNTNYIKFSPKHLTLIKNKTWFISKTGYATTHHNQKTTYMHNIILEHLGYCYHLLKTEHINGNKLDNQIENIRIINPENIIKKGVEQRKKNFNRIGIKESEIPTWIRYTKQYQNHGDFFQIKVTINNKTIDHKTTKSLNVSIEEKLINALSIRAKIVIDNPELLDKVIDDKVFNTIGKFLRHTKKLITKYAQQSELDLIPEMFEHDTVLIRKITKLARTLSEFPEHSKYTPNELPKYTIYVPAKNGKGSYIEYRKYDPKTYKTIRFKTTSKKSVSLDAKIMEIRDKINDIMKPPKKCNIKKKPIIISSNKQIQ